MKQIALAVALCVLNAPARAEDEATRVKLVEYMLKTPIDEADPKLVAPFMKLDTSALPAKLRDKARAKQMEIDAIVKIHKGKKKGPFRFPAPDCVPKRYGPEGLRIMTMMIGNSEIEAAEEEYLEKRSDCTEDQLLCEFSLNVVLIPRTGKPPLKRYWMMEGDPLMAWLGEYRSKGSKYIPPIYFQELKPTCQKRVGG